MQSFWRCSIGSKFNRMRGLDENPRVEKVHRDRGVLMALYIPGERLMAWLFWALKDQNAPFQYNEHEVCVRVNPLQRPRQPVSCKQLGSWRPQGHEARQAIHSKTLYGELGLQKGFGIRVQQGHSGVTIVIITKVFSNQLTAINKFPLFRYHRTYRVFS